MKFTDAILEAIGDEDRSIENFTIGDLVSAIMAIDKDSDALEFYESYIAWQETRFAVPHYTPRQVVDANIGWCFGEGMSDERRDMWCRVTGASHPVFGRAKVSAEEAFTKGMEKGEKDRD